MPGSHLKSLPLTLALWVFSDRAYCISGMRALAINGSCSPSTWLTCRGGCTINRTISGTAEKDPIPHANRPGDPNRFVVQAARWHRHLNRLPDSRHYRPPTVTPNGDSG